MSCCLRSNLQGYSNVFIFRAFRTGIGKVCTIRELIRWFTCLNVFRNGWVRWNFMNNSTFSKISVLIRPILTSSENLNPLCNSHLGAILNWVKGEISRKSEHANTTMQLLTPFQTASIGSATGLIAWVFCGPQRTLYLFLVAGVAMLVTILSLARNKVSRERDECIEL